MKRLISILLISLIPSSIFAIGGLGLNLSQGSFSVDASYPKTDIPGVTLMNGPFDGSFGFGGYVYIDLIPFVDIEFEANAHGNLYDIEFQNAFGEMPPLEFAWVSSNTYTTVRKKSGWTFNTIPCWSPITCRCRDEHPQHGSCCRY